MGAERLGGVQRMAVMTGGADNHVVRHVIRNTVLQAEPARKVNAFGPNLRRQLDVCADQQHEAAACANGLQLRRQGGAPGRFIVPQDDGGPCRQGPRDQKRVRRPLAVCQESKRERRRRAGGSGSPFEPLCGGC